MLRVFGEAFQWIGFLQAMVFEHCQLIAIANEANQEYGHGRLRRLIIWANRGLTMNSGADGRSSFLLPLDLEGIFVSRIERAGGFHVKELVHLEPLPGAVCCH